MKKILMGIFVATVGLFTTAECANPNLTKLTNKTNTELMIVTTTESDYSEKKTYLLPGEGQYFHQNINATITSKDPSYVGALTGKIKPPFLLPPFLLSSGYDIKEKESGSQKILTINPSSGLKQEKP